MIVLIRTSFKEARMAEPIFKDIYIQLKQDLDEGRYPYQSFLPSEAKLCKRFMCSRSSVRRALSILTSEGYLQPQQGKGVRVIANVQELGASTGIYGLEAFKDVARRQGFKALTRCVLWEKVLCTKELADKSSFAPGSELLHIIRVRIANDRAVSLDESYYIASEVEGLTPQEVERSVFYYLEHTLHMRISLSKRKITVEQASDIDKRYLDLDDFPAVAVVCSNTFDATGTMFEYTQTRTVAGFFSSYETTLRSAVK